jgi:hypothetical protein
MSGFMEENAHAVSVRKPKRIGDTSSTVRHWMQTTTKTPEQVPNTRVRGSKQIYFALVMDGIRPCIKYISLLDDSILKIDHRAIFLDLDLIMIFGAPPERLERPQLRNLKLDDPCISDRYRNFLDKQLNAITSTTE